MVQARSLVLGAAATLGLCWGAVVGSGCGAPAEPGGGPSVVGERAAAAAETDRLRLLTWNVGGLSEPSTAVFEQAERVRQHADGFDIVLLNEVFDAKAREQWYQHLGDLFPFALTDIDGPGIDLDDSGLMVLSRLPFDRMWWPTADMPSQSGSVTLWAPEWFQKEVEVIGGLDLYTRFDEFRSGSGADGKKAKGAVMFHVWGGSRRYNIVATNLNRGKGEAALRREQLEDISTLINDRTNPDIDEETIVAGDFNIDAAEAGVFTYLDTTTPSVDFANSEYRATVWGKLHNQPFFDAWRTTSRFDAGVTGNLNLDDLGGGDPDAFAGRHRSEYFLIKGSRYHTPGALTWASPSAFMSSTGDPHCVNWVRTTLRSASSGHFGVALEMGPRSPHCNPAMALPGREDGVATELEFTRPGADAWLYFATPGTYTLGLGKGDRERGLAYEVFSEDNLSRGMGALPDHAKLVELAGSACGHAETCAFETERFFAGQKGFFVRIYSPDGLTTGPFRFYSLRHDCSSNETACELQPGAPPFGPSMPAGQPFVGHFTFHSMRTVNKNVPQTISFDVSTSTPLANVRLTTTRLGNSGSTSFRPSHHREHPEALAVEYQLKVERSTNNATYVIGAKTNLTWVSGSKDDTILPIYQAFANPPAAMKLVCQDESGADFAGEEEIRAEIYADGIFIAGPPLLFRNDLDAGEAMSMAGVPDFGFVEKAYIVVDELKGDVYGADVDDTATHEFTKLAPNTPHGQSRQEPIQLWNVADPTSNGPLMQLQYHISHGRVH